MKTLNIFILFLFFSTVTLAQDIHPSEVPEAVKTTFMKENPKAKDVEWERSMENYKVEFDIGRMEHEVWYNSSGKVIKKELDINEAELPQEIRDVIKSKYNGYRIDDVEMMWQNDKTTYKVEVEKGNDEWKLVFDANGTILQEHRD